MLADPVRFFNNPNANMLLVRKTTEELRELKFKSKELYSKLDPGMKFLERESTWIAPSGARLWLSYLDRDEDVTRYQGQAFTWIGFDELTQWSSPYAWNYMRSRLRTTDPNLKLYQRATTNPGGVGHQWVKKMFIDPAPHGTAFEALDEETGEVLRWPKDHSDKEKAGQPLFKRMFIPATLKDNPYLTMDGAYEANLLSLPEAERKKLLEGSWDIQEGAAFPEFNRAIHVVEPFDIPRSWMRFRACDYGYRDHTGVVWIAVDPSGQLVVYREMYEKGIVATKLGEKIKEHDGSDRIHYGVLDSSLWHKRGDTGPSLAEQVMACGIRFRPSDRSAGSRVAGKNELHRRLMIDDFTGKPGLVIFSTCTNLIAQLPSVPLDKKNPEDVDTDSEDHLYDALRYGVMTRPKTSVFDFSSTPKRTGFQAFDKKFGY